MTATAFIYDRDFANQGSYWEWELERIARQDDETPIELAIPANDDDKLPGEDILLPEVLLGLRSLDTLDEQDGYYGRGRGRSKELTLRTHRDLYASRTHCRKAVARRLGRA